MCNSPNVFIRNHDVLKDVSLSLFCLFNYSISLFNSAEVTRNISLHSVDDTRAVKPEVAAGSAERAILSASIHSGSGNDRSFSTSRLDGK